METENIVRFWTEYEKQLAEAVKADPKGFVYFVDQVPSIVAKFRKLAAERGIRTIAIDSSSFRKTCKHFAIPCTYKGIEEFLKKGAQS